MGGGGSGCIWNIRTSDQELPHNIGAHSQHCIDEKSEKELQKDACPWSLLLWNFLRKSNTYLKKTTCYCFLLPFVDI